VIGFNSYRFCKKLIVFSYLLIILFIVLSIGCLSIKTQKKTIETALKSYEIGDYSASASEFENYINEFYEGKYIEKAYFLGGISYFQIGKYDKALDNYNKLIKEFPFSLYIRKAEFERCRTLYMMKHYKAAKSALESFLNTGSGENMYEGLILLGRCYLEEEANNMALYKFKEAFQYAETSEKSNKLHFLLTRTYIQLKDLKNARKELDNLAKPLDKESTCKKLMLEYEFSKFVKDVNRTIRILQEIDEMCMGAVDGNNARELIIKTIDGLKDNRILESIIKIYITKFPAEYASFKKVKKLSDDGTITELALKVKEFCEKFPQSPYRSEVENFIKNIQPKNAISSHKIGCILPLSGKYEVFGKNVLRSIQLAIELFNRQYPEFKVDLIKRDDKGETEKATSAFEDLVAQEDVIAVIGPLLSVNAKAMLQATETNKIPVISPSVSSQELIGKSKFFIINSITIEQQIQQLIEYGIAKLRLNDYVLMYPENKYGLSIKNTFFQISKTHSDIYVHNIGYVPGINDFKDRIKDISKIDRRPIAIILPDSPDVVSMIASQIRFYGIGSYQLLGLNNWNSEDIFKSGKQYIQGGIFCNNFFRNNEDPAVKYFYDEYKKAYSQEPDYLQAQAYDTTIMILQKLKEGYTTRLSLNEALHNIRNFEGVSGLTSINSKGDVYKKVTFFTVDNGEFKPCKNQ
jgi:branched-chain amino acid transport system substrate-binding protein